MFPYLYYCIVLLNIGRKRQKRKRFAVKALWGVLKKQITSIPVKITSIPVKITSIPVKSPLNYKYTRKIVFTNFHLIQK